MPSKKDGQKISRTTQSQAHSQHQNQSFLLVLIRTTITKIFASNVWAVFQVKTLMKLLVLSNILLYVSSAIAMDQKEADPKLTTLLSMHDINLEDADTWPNQRVVNLVGGEQPHALRFKCDPLLKTYTISLEREAYGSVLSELITGKIEPANPTAFDQTFVVNGQPHFVKFSIDSSYKVTLERISTPLSFYMTATKPIIVQKNG